MATRPPIAAPRRACRRSPRCHPLADPHDPRRISADASHLLPPRSTILLPPSPLVPQSAGAQARHRLGR
eukprot:4766883-Prymnesium_polylepis.1